MAEHTPGSYSIFSHLGHCPECGATEDPAKVKAQRDELLAALKASVDSFCSYCCPSVWKTADGRPHSEQCKANRAAIAKVEARE